MRARPEFIRKWQSIVPLITGGQLAEAVAQIDALTPTNNYEEARLLVLGAYIARAKGDTRGELRAWNSAMELHDSLEPELITNALHRSFVLNLQASQFANALLNYRQLESSGAQSDNERNAMQRLSEIVDGNAPLVTPGSIERGYRSKSGARALWRVALLRSAFALHDVTGNVGRIEVRCAERWYVAPFATEQTWTIPMSWGACALDVYGDEGATVSLVEYQRDSGPPAARRSVDF